MTRGSAETDGILARFPQAARMPAALLAIGGACLVLAATARFGCALTPDSGVYLAAARSLRSGGGLVSFDGEPYVTGPPLYPAVLAASPGLADDPPAGLRFVNAAAFALFLVLSSLFLRRVLPRSAPRVPNRDRVGAGILPLAGLAALLLCKPLVELFSSTWSEIVFLPIVAAFLLLLQVIEAEGLTRARLLSLALLAAAGALTRYTGVAMILTGLIVLMTSRRVEPGGAGVRPSGARHRILDPLLFGVVGSAPLALWLMRNRVLTGSFTGLRGTSNMSLGDVAGGVGGTLVAWAGLTRLPSIAAAAVLAAVFGGAALSLARRPALRRSCRPVLRFLLIYGALLVSLSLGTGFDRIDARLLSPVLLPLLGVLLAAGQAALPGAPATGTVRAAAGTLLALWLAWSGARAGAFVLEAHRSGAGGFATESWQSSPLAAALGGPGGPILSNEPAAVYLLSGKQASLSPRRTLYRSGTEPADDLARLDWLIETRGEGRLAWFDALATPHVLTPEALRDALARGAGSTGSTGAGAVVERSATFSDGSLWTLKPGAPVRPDGPEGPPTGR